MLKINMTMRALATHLRDQFQPQERVRIESDGGLAVASVKSLVDDFIDPMNFDPLAIHSNVRITLEPPVVQRSGAARARRWRR